MIRLRVGFLVAALAAFSSAGYAQGCGGGSGGGGITGGSLAGGARLLTGPGSLAFEMAMQQRVRSIQQQQFVAFQQARAQRQARQRAVRLASARKRRAAELARRETLRERNLKAMYARRSGKSSLSTTSMLAGR